MYEAFFGLRERPFQLTPNPRFLVLDPGHREALATLRYGLASALGITLLLGDAGTGKTTLLRAALRAESQPEHRYVVLSNPTLTPTEFFETVADGLGLPEFTNKGRFLRAFERDALARQRVGGRMALVVDEAQCLTFELFEELRLLANLETETAKLVNLVLVGQRELADRLNEPALRQFRQRIVLRCMLAPLDLDSTAAYIATRLRLAGAVAGEVFTRDSVRTIYEASGGIPRSISVVCENALLAGYAAQMKPIERSIVLDVCRDLDLPVDDARGPDVDAPQEAADRASAPDPRLPVNPFEAPVASRRWFSFGGKHSRPATRRAGRSEEAAEDAAATASLGVRRTFKFF